MIEKNERRGSLMNINTDKSENINTSTNVNKNKLKSRSKKSCGGFSCYLLSLFAFIFIFALVLYAALFLAAGAAIAETGGNVALKSAYDKYISSYSAYLEALNRGLDEKTLKLRAQRYITDMSAYKKLLNAGLVDSQNQIGGGAAAAVDETVETELTLEELSGMAADFPTAGRLPAKAARAGEAMGAPLTGEAKKQYAMAKVGELKNSLNVLSAAYEKKAADSRQKYNETSWFSPISKAKSAYNMFRDKFRDKKVKSTMQYYETPRKDNSNSSFLKEIAVEFGHVTNISKLLYDTRLDSHSFVFKNPEADKDFLIVYTMPAPHGINWASPKALTLAGGLNQLTTFHTSAKHPIGHVFMALKTSASPEIYVAGMTTLNNTEEVKLITHHGYCLGILFTDLMGKFDDGAELMKQTEERYETGRVSYMKFLLSPSMGKRLLRYFDEYKEKKCDEHYGGANRSRYAEGGGCSPFGVSFIDVAGFMKPEYENAWKVTLEVPKKLCGGPAFGKRVSFKSLVTAGGWAKPGEDSAQLEMWDPTLMYRWMINEWKKEFANPSGKYILEKNKKTMSLVIDCRDIKADESAPIWLSGPNPYRQHGLRYGPDPYKVEMER